MCWFPGICICSTDYASNGHGHGGRLVVLVVVDMKQQPDGSLGYAYVAQDYASNGHGHGGRLVVLVVVDMKQQPETQAPVLKGSQTLP